MSEQKPKVSAEPRAGTQLADLAALRQYLAASGHDATPHHDGLRIAGNPPIDVDWAAEHRQVRFTIQPALTVPANRRAKVAEVVGNGNALSGIPVWRAEPQLTAEVTAPVAADGSVSSAEVDRAVRILQTTVARDLADLARAAGG